jgi:hypothetical protein
MLHNTGLVVQLIFSRSFNNWHCFRGEWIAIHSEAKYCELFNVGRLMMWFGSHIYVQAGYSPVCRKTVILCPSLTSLYFRSSFPAEKIDCTRPKATNRGAHCVSQPHSYNHTSLQLIENKICVVTIRWPVTVPTCKCRRLETWIIISLQFVSCKICILRSKLNTFYSPVCFTKVNPTVYQNAWDIRLHFTRFSGCIISNCLVCSFSLGRFSNPQKCVEWWTFYKLVAQNSAFMWQYLTGLNPAFGNSVH